jgi:hypothetical protein
MPLSISKLENLLSMKGFVPNRYFVMYDVVVYMEIISIKDADTFLLYIPSKYKFSVPKSTNVFKIKYIDVDEKHNNTVDDYAGEPDEHTVENEYREIDAQISPDIQGDNIGNQLEENYKRSITIKDISSDDSKELNDIIRQLKRLKFCVQNVKYKIAITYKNYLCSIKRDDSIECFLIKRHSGKAYKKLFVTCDLELMYEKMDSLILNMSTIRKGLYHILDKNHFSHSRTLHRLLNEKNAMIQFSDDAYSKKVEYEIYIKESKEMLYAINKSEKVVLEKMYDIKEKYNNPRLKGLHNDIDKSHQLSKLNTDLSEIQKIKEEVVKTIFDLKTKREDTMLTVDKIMFDNNVMVECVIRNFRELGLVCGNK